MHLSLRVSAPVLRRRLWLAAVLSASLAMSGLSAVHKSAAADSATPGRPNVLVILTDDQRFDTMDVMPKTLGWFADGTQFDNAYATIPICAPMRSSLMSGRYQHNHGVLNNQSAPKYLDQSATIQKYLHDAGYQTGLDGKFLINWNYATTPPPNFDHFADFAGGYTNVRWNVDGKVQTSSQYVTDFQSDRAINFLDDFHQDPSRPWYLYLTPEAPHEPMVPAPQYANAPLPPWQPSPAVGADRSSKPAFIRNQNDSMSAAQTARDAQLRTLLSVDDMMDRIMQHLSDTGQLDNTLVIYTGDSGWLYDEYGMKSKSVPYLPSVHVPFLVRWPGHLPAGAVDPRQMALVDVAPSVLDATAVHPALKYPMDGRSFFSPSVRGENLLEYHYSPDFTKTPSWAAIRSASFDYVEWYQDEAGTQLQAREYYDLTKDPWELDNLLGDQDPSNDPPPATLADLSARLARYRACRGTDGPSACP